MLRSFMRPVPALVLALAAGAAPLAAASPTLTPAQLAAAKAQQHARTAQALASLAQLAGQLHLGPSAGFQPHQASTNAQGRTIIRFHQTHEGHRVWAGEAIAHVEPDGQVRTLTQGLKSQVALASATTRLSADEAKAIALKNLAPKGAMPQPPKVEQVVFPTRFTGGLATRVDAARNRVVWDKQMSIWAKPPSDAYVLAYEVRTLLTNQQDGHQEMCYIVDANTGTILRKWNALQGDTPAQGSGASFYRGTVPLSTTQAEDGTYALIAKNRGSLPNPFAMAQGVNWTGLTLAYGSIDLNTGNLNINPFAGHATNTWGSGQLMPFPYDFNATWDPWDWSHWWAGTLFEYSPDGMSALLQGTLSANGETTAVDAHYGLSTTWDFYQNVFGRDGIDDKGSSTFGTVHNWTYGQPGMMPYFDNAYWAPWYFGMVFGDGSYGAPGAPYVGFKALTELDITGHELSHGVTEYSANLIYAGESGGLNEGNSDIFGKMVQAYADGGATGATVPNFPAGDLSKWEVGRNSGPSTAEPLRFMYHPSLDGASADGWFDGIELIDVHYSSGPLNRFFYFLSCGASATPASTTYSPYYPPGFTGIGNDKAARIWYKTLTEHLVPDADFMAARDASILSAKELYGDGADCPESLAVAKAWSAVNVGLAPGQAPRVGVTFPIINGEGSWLDSNAVPTGILRKVQVFPTRTNVQIVANVVNTTNKALTFTTPKWEGYAPAGTIKADGTWTTPDWTYYFDLLSVKAVSQADPSQFARSEMLLMDLDCDTDGDIDAVDLGATAMSWCKEGAYFNTPNPFARVAGGGDWDVVFFTQAFANAFPVK
ncbi:MAG: M4 family metallopeptidase [Holophagaceae bacterium]|nr:M4 family metallopeptidase [Holophagaceae bacterium]